MLLNKQSLNIFNLGSDEELSIKALAEWILRINNNNKLKLKILNESDSKAQYYVAHLNNLNHLN